MNSKLSLPLLFLMLLLSACGNEIEKRLIGTWRVDKVEISEPISEAEEKDLERMQGTLMKFMKDGTVQINMDGDSYETHWSLNDNILEIRNGGKFSIKELTEATMTLEAELSYSKGGETVSYNFTQYMSIVK